MCQNFEFGIFLFITNPGFSFLLRLSFIFADLLYAFSGLKPWVGDRYLVFVLQPPPPLFLLSSFLLSYVALIFSIEEIPVLDR